MGTIKIGDRVRHLGSGELGTVAAFVGAAAQVKWDAGNTATSWPDDLADHSLGPSASTLGRVGGKSTSAAKATAARANGARGGRPRKKN
jgi:hypothetical protein